MKYSSPPPVSLFRLFVLPLALLALVPCKAAVSAGTDNIHLENAWLAEAPPMSRVMAGYMKIQNPGSQPVAIDKITSADFSSIEIHRTVEINGMARMQRQDGINIPAGADFELAPGGFHLMMFNPKKGFHAGDSSRLVFSFADGSTATFDVTVKKTSDYINK